MFWIAFRYNILYVTKSDSDTGGLLYPAALNQLFVGVYMFEVCLVGLFFLARDEDQQWTCLGQAVIMIAVTLVTGGFQAVLSQAFGPLLRFLPHVEGIEPTKLGNVNDEDSSVCEHNALRAKKPTIWIPKDSFGISDNEVSETRETYQGIWISNDKARIDLRGRVLIDEDSGICCT